MKKLFALIFTFVYFVSYGQLSEFTQYQFNYYAINPAFAGENGPFTIKAVVGNQFNGNLRFNQLSHVLVLDGQLYNKTGLAFKSSSDNYGVGTSNNLGLTLSQGFKVGDLKLKAGVTGGVNLTPSRIGLGNTGTQTDFNLGFGVLASYEAIFVGFSQPVAFESQSLFTGTGKSPMFVNVGYSSPDDFEFLTLNANVLYGYLDGLSNYDFNLKLWFDKRLGMGASFRINNIYTHLTHKKSLNPFAEFKFSQDLLIGLGYSPSSLRLSNTTNPSSPNFKLDGMFQFYIRYNKNDDGGDSWYYDRF